MKAARDARGSRTNSETSLQTRGRIGEWPTRKLACSRRLPFTPRKFAMKF
jgi:hypothetical protein